MAYSFSRSITIDQSLCGAGDSTDFPMLFSGTYLYLRTVGNGGDVQNGSGFDIVFASDAFGSSLLNWEVERYNATTGELVAWVQIPTLSASVDTVIYILYGNGAISTFQGDVNGTWDANYRMVCHYPDGSSLTTLDSTSNGADGTVTGGVAAAAGPGFTDGCGDFNGTTGRVDSSGYDSNTTKCTYEAWIFPDANGGVFIADGASLGAPYFYLHTDNCLHASCAPLNNPTKSIETVPNGTWAHVVCTFQTIIDNRIYINGVECTYSDVGTPGGYPIFTGIKVGTWFNNSLYFNGKIDEVRISNSVRDANYILATYNSQNDPSTFYAVGSPTPIGGGGVQVNLGNIITLAKSVRLH